MVLTGGGWSHKIGVVTRYNMEGKSETLPSLIIARYGHACGKFINKDNVKVSF